MGPDAPEACAPTLPCSAPWWGTVLYPRHWWGVFLGMQFLLGWVGVPLAAQASLAALPAVLALLVSLPAQL
jgi:hypothetical protein